jgi:tellurite resistance protein
LIKLRKVLGISYGEYEGMREKGMEVQTQILDKLVKETPEAQRQKVYDYIKGVAIRDGQITPDEQDMLDELGMVLGLTFPESQMKKVYDHIKGVAMRDGKITSDEQEMLEELGAVLGLTSEGAPGPASFASPPAISEPIPAQQQPPAPQKPAGAIMPPPPAPPKAS